MIARLVNLTNMLRHERSSREVIDRIQNEKFLALFRHAYHHVPFYRELYLGLGIKETDIQSAADIHKLPIINKQQLRAAATDGKLWGKTDGYCRIQTSGSSGSPFYFYVNRRDNHWRKAQSLLPYVSSGRKLWSSVLRSRQPTLEGASWLQRLGVFNETRLISDASAAEHFRLLIDLQPDFLQGYPSVLRLLALHIVANGLPVPALKKIFTDSELLTSNTRALLMRVFKTDVVDVFGSYETDNIAYECSAHRGYHIAEDSVIVELSDQDVSEDADGTGNLVCTVLHNAVTPFIRYDLGDLVGISTEPCECGRTTRTLSVLKGRANDLITRPDGTQRNAMVLIDFCTNSFLGTATEFQIRQRNAYEFEISVVWDRSGEPVDSVEFDRAFAAAFSPAKATIRAVDKIRRTPTGKYTLFIGLDQPERDAE